MTEQNQQPRALDEIQKEYGELVGRAGQIQYQLFVLDKDLKTINDRILVINHEAAARKELDKKASEQTQG
jgi:hypothetical protein